MFAVAAASGRVGARTAEALLKRGQKVRGLVRQEERGAALAARHAEVVVVDLLDTAALTKALTGVSGAFFVVPTPPPERDLLEASEALVHSLVAATRQAKLGSVVLLSSIGAQHPSGTGPVVALHRAEKAFVGAAKSVTFLRPALALEAWAPLVVDALDSGRLPFAGHVHTTFAQVGAKDVGEVAAKVLEEAATGQRFVEVAGAQKWSPDDVAAGLSSLLGQRIVAQEVSPEEEQAALEKAGLTPARAALIVERSRAHARGSLQFAHPSEVKHGTTSLHDALATLV